MRPLTRRAVLAAPFVIATLTGAGPARGAPGDPLPGQMILTGFRGTAPASPEVAQVCRMLARGEIAGVLLLERNIRSPGQLARLTDTLRAAAPALPPIIAVDQEGGKVARLGVAQGFLDWRGAADLARDAACAEDIYSYYAPRARQLAEAGINLNLAPVVDLALEPRNPVITRLGRAFGRDPDTVLRHAEMIIRAHRSADVKTCLKHFPGHGSALHDSHDSPVDLRATWKAVEIVPFQRLVDAGLADALMLAHVIHPYLSDSPETPVSLSRAAGEIVREVMGFRGPLISDGMQMGAITARFSETEAAMLALNAGNDLLIYANQRGSESIDTAPRVAAALARALAEGRVLAEDLHDRIARVTALRARLF